MIWLVGQQGMLGRELQGAFTAAGLAWIGSDREVDFTDRDALEAFAKGRTVDWVVNCAAYTAVDRAEEDAELCRRLNVEGPATLGRWAKDHGAAVLHLSTDYVFSGSASVPYDEDSPVGPTGVYGRTKAEGETALREVCDRHLILRTAWLYGYHGPNFVYTMLKLMRRQDRLGVVADQWGAPTWTGDLARVVVALVSRPDAAWGTYHASGEGKTSWHGFAEAIYELARERGLLSDRPVLIERLSTAQYPTKAKRPAWSVLSKAKLRSTFGLEFPPWHDSLKVFLAGPLDAGRYQS